MCVLVYMYLHAEHLIRVVFTPQKTITSCNKLSLELFFQHHHEYNWYCAPARAFQRICLQKNSHTKKLILYEPMSCSLCVALRYAVHDFNRYFCIYESAYECSHSKSRLTIAKTANLRIEHFCQQVCRSNVDWHSNDLSLADSSWVSLSCKLHTNIYIILNKFLRT